uniref:Uncharacterized protein n=1 Tax=Arundo donax TaxID=35708 RepID=A0A0A9DXK2_ARUDO
MFEQVLSILIKLRCRAMRNTRHSASKLLIACSSCMFKTFIATTKPSLSWPL